MRMPEVLRMVGLSRSTLWNMIHDGRFPRQIRLGPKSIGWRDTEVFVWIEEKLNAAKD